MKPKKKLLSVLLVLAMLLALAPSVLAASVTAYWHEKRQAANYSDWMASLPDTMPMNKVSIPGTHDSMAYTGTVLLSDIVLTQSMTLSQQLASGIRYLDVRIDHKGDHFSLYHGPFYLNADFEDVLDTVSAFLKAHPREFIVMRLKQENEWVSSEKMGELFRRYYDRYEGLFYGSLNSSPTVGELRGKIFVLYNGFPTQCGKSFYRADCQDVFEFTTNWDLYPKWEAVKEQLLNASTGSPSTTYINHLTGSGGSFPFFVASGKITHGTYAPQLSTGILCRDSCSRYPDFPRKAMPLGLKEIDFLGLNQLTTDYINEHRLANIGIIPADFPGEALISAIIACNFR